MYTWVPALPAEASDEYCNMTHKILDLQMFPGKNQTGVSWFLHIFICESLVLSETHSHTHQHYMKNIHLQLFCFTSMKPLGSFYTYFLSKKVFLLNIAMGHTLEQEPQGLQSAEQGQS